MIYSELYLQNNQKKVPSFIPLVVIFLSTVFIWKFFSKTSIPSQASKKNARRVEIANLSQNQVTIYWQTYEKEIGWLILGEAEKKLDQVFLDERDTTENKGKYFNHLVILKNLKKNQKYYFKIISNNRLIDKNGSPYSFKTVNGQYLDSNLKPAYGRVLNFNKEPLNQGVVILNFNNSYPLITLLKTTGEWMLPLNNVVDKTTNSFRVIDAKEKVLIEIFDENNGKSNIEATVNNLSPLPEPIIIGNDYRFISKDQVLGIKNTRQKTSLISIIYPKEDSIIPSNRPLIKGTALPLKEVFLILKGKIDYSFRTKTDINGDWKITLNKNLPPGNYTIELKTEDEDGKNFNLIRKFIIAKSGETVLGEATSSAKLSPTPLPVTPTVRPTEVTPTIKPAGRNPLPLLITALSFIITGFGFLLAF